MPKVIFNEKDGTKHEFDAPEGTTLQELAKEKHLSLESACEGALACSTCHVIVKEEWFAKLEDASEDEEDLLDMAFGLTPTSRLACQLKLTSDLDGIEVTIPPSRNT